MILVDTSVIVAWLDATHEFHRVCAQAITHWHAEDDLSVSSVTLAELAAGGRARESIEEDLAEFFVLGLDAEAAFRAGLAFRQFHPAKAERQPVLPDFFIRAQAAVLGWKHLTNDRRRRRVFPDVEFLFP